MPHHPSESRSAPPRGRGEAKALCPPAHEAIPSVYVASRTQYPLIYKKRIVRVEKAKPGDLVAVRDARDQVFAYGLFNPRSEIVVRVLWQQTEYPTVDAWRTKFQRAVDLRRNWLSLDARTNAYRVIHAEGDDLSGLVADRFGDVLSLEAFSLGMYQRAEAIASQLAPLCGTAHWVMRGSPQFLSQEGIDPPGAQSPDFPATAMIQEEGTRFRVRFEGGHKTGFFCDQRENRLRLSQLCEGKSVLDLCCYSGGFAVQAKKRGGAAEVVGVDLDEAPLALAKENANLNQVRVKFVQADAFAYLRDLIAQGRRFDIVVLDPPKFIRTRMELEEGTRKHFALNRLAAQVVRPGGLLLSCSCAGLLPEAEFTTLVLQAIRKGAGDDDPGHGGSVLRQALPRQARLLAKTGAGMDHPVSALYPEGEYLKAVWAIVE